MILRSQTLSLLIFILCLIRIPSMSLAILFKDIQPEKYASNDETTDIVVIWKKRYLLVCEFVESLNDFIGKPLLIFMAYAFMSFTGHAFYVMHGHISSATLMLPRLYIYGWVVLKNGISVIWLAITSEKICSEVSVTSRLLSSPNSIVTWWIEMRLGIKLGQSTEKGSCIKLRHSNPGKCNQINHLNLLKLCRSYYTIYFPNRLIFLSWTWP